MILKRLSDGPALPENMIILKLFLLMYRLPLAERFQLVLSGGGGGGVWLYWL